MGVFVSGGRQRGQDWGLPPECQARCRCLQGILSQGHQEPGVGPRTITLDGYAASHRAVREMKADGQLLAETKVRSSKYLNNLIEQDHRGVKLRIAPMLGFKWFRTAAITIAGIELLRRIHKGQFDLRGLRLKDRSTPAAWNAVLAA